MSRRKSTNQRVTVTRTKLPKAPWQEDSYIYDIKKGSDSIWSENIFIVFIQIIAGICGAVYVYNVLP